MSFAEGHIFPWTGTSFKWHNNKSELSLKGDVLNLLKVVQEKPDGGICLVRLQSAQIMCLWPFLAPIGVGAIFISTQVTWTFPGKNESFLLFLRWTAGISTAEGLNKGRWRPARPTVAFSWNEIKPSYIHIHHWVTQSDYSLVLSNALLLLCLSPLMFSIVGTVTDLFVV